MSKLDRAQRDKLSEADFAGPHRSFPIVDQSDVEDAAHLIGHAADPEAVKSRIVAICKRRGLKEPVAWSQGTAEHSMVGYRESPLDVAFFSAAPPPGYVRRKGPIFRLGDYPDKEFSLNAEEADRAIAAFSPIPGDVEHTPTILSGELGVLREVWREGDVLHGEADVPVWLDKILQPAKSQVSCAWDTASKQLKGWGWVLDPRIKGAELTSAFAAFRREAESVQVNRATTPTPYLSPYKQKEKRYMPLIDKLKSRIAAFSTSDDTVATPLAQPIATPEPIPVTPTPTPTPAAQAPATPTPTPTPTPAEFGADMDEATAEFRAAQITNRAIELVDRAIASGHLHSSGRKLAISVFSGAGFDNEASGPTVVTFSRANGEVLNDRVQMLSELLSHTPQHNLFAATLPVQVFNATKSKDEEQSAAEAGKAQAEAFNKSVVPGYGGTHSHNNGTGA